MRVEIVGLDISYSIFMFFPEIEIIFLIRLDMVIEMSYLMFNKQNEILCLLMANCAKLFRSDL